MVDIVFSSDNGYVPQLLVASASAVYAARKASDAFTIHVLDCGIEDLNWAKYTRRIDDVSSRHQVVTNIVRHKVDMQQFVDVPPWTNGSRAAWARILLPKLLPSVSCCVYSDCDVLFIDNPAGMLDELRASGKAIVGHKNPFGDSSPDAKWFRFHKLPFNADIYFCSGLVAMDLDWMRANDVVEACWRFMRDYPRPVSVDQTVLNYVFANNKGLLSEGWGVFTHECYKESLQIKAIHFSGGWPWVKAKNAYDALCIRLSEVAIKLWCEFQIEILGDSTAVHPSVSFVYRIEAIFILIGCRALECLGVVPSRLHCLVELVNAYSGPSSSLKRALDRIVNGK